MKEYKLIKTYPGSPELGTVVKKDGWYYHTIVEGIPFIFLAKYVENNPEFWEEVIEKDYEVLSYIDTAYMIIYEVGGYGDKVKFSENLISKHFKIHSIKRLSDGEVFSIGDRIFGGYTISKIQLCDSKSKINLTLKKDNESHVGDNNINDIVKDKKLFTSEDGVDIFVGDKYYFASKNLNNFKRYGERTAHKGSRYDEDIIVFSTKEKAEECILYNKPCLSLNDLLNCEEIVRGEKSFELSRMFKRFKELVKSKV